MIHKIESYVLKVHTIKTYLYTYTILVQYRQSRKLLALFFWSAAFPSIGGTTITSSVIMLLKGLPTRKPSLQGCEPNCTVYNTIINHNTSMIHIIIGIIVTSTNGGSGGSILLLFSNVASLLLLLARAAHVAPPRASMIVPNNSVLRNHPVITITVVRRRRRVATMMVDVVLLSSSSLRSLGQTLVAASL